MENAPGIGENQKSFFGIRNTKSIYLDRSGFAGRDEIFSQDNNFSFPFRAITNNIL